MTGMKAIKSVLLIVAKVVKDVFSGCVTIVGGIIIIGWFLGFMVLALFSLADWWYNRIDVKSPDCQSLARSVLHGCNIEEGKFKRVHHGYKTKIDFHGGHYGAYAIEVSDVDASKLTTSSGWIRGDQLSVKLEITILDFFRRFREKNMEWLPKKHELKSADMFVYSPPQKKEWDFSVILLRLSDKMLFYLYVQT